MTKLSDRILRRQGTRARRICAARRASASGFPCIRSSKHIYAQVIDDDAGRDAGVRVLDGEDGARGH